MIDLRTLCVDISMGYRITLGLDMYSTHYQINNEKSDLKLSLNYSKAKLNLTFK